ncbi:MULTISPECIES: hypothetical protein [Pontibacter]|uniref:Uncharacterized protein n=1 Tax=Pontibacter lucknowensis TaxID=1077936 RepID=A0A1N6YFE0_9BACT|nr:MULTISPECIES: hypothetical protein [Pontibacter]EJF07927.1 hypothetical protein O71_23967 [Pontibacter sp. BAB1700]SIR13239.1 hypothetical protein SAMN05421545_2459 [Pontibacter lucknowensis]
MKKLSLVFALTILACTWSYAQAVPASLVTTTAQRTEEYCELRFFVKALFSTKVHAHVDFGNGEEVLKDTQGNNIDFISPMAALNYMNSKGWKLVDTYPRVHEGSSCTYYVMKRSLE